MISTKLAIIQARMSSSRLPGKVMLDIAGKPMIQHVIERAKAARLVDQVLIATTIDSTDDILQHFCLEQGLPCYRGSHSDVLDRFYQAAIPYRPDVIIRLTADCPLLDPDLIDLTILAFLGKKLSTDETELSLITNSHSPSTYPFDFCANRLPPPWQRTLPIGLDVEVCTFDALVQAWRQAKQTYQREHVMPYLYDGVVLPQAESPDRPGWYLQQGISSHGFKVALVNHLPGYGSLRWTVDTETDLDLVRRIFFLLEDPTSFSWQHVLELLERYPELSTINAEVKHKSAFDVDKRTAQT